MEETVPPPRSFNARILPWILGAGFLALYLLTAHPWVGPGNIQLVGQMLGWEPDAPYSEPYSFVIGKLLGWLPAGRLPHILNVLSGVFGATTIGILSRCVALMPHDRTREQRVRGHADGAMLHGWFAPLPVVFAAGLLGCQLTFWENATLQTGEMLDLLLFAFCTLCILEYRLDLKDSWLLAGAFVWGLGMTTNWAMIGFSPLYLCAIVGVRGWSFFNAGFLTRLILWGLLGLVAYLIVPIGQALGGESGLGFWWSLRANLMMEKAYLFGIPRGRPLLLGLVLVLPLMFAGVRWQGSQTSTIERYMTIGGIVLLQLLWLVAIPFVAFDTPFSARRLMYLDESSGGLPMLTFSFTGALAAGYLAGWFLVVGFAAPTRTWEKPNPLLHLLGRLAGVVVVVASVGVPAALVLRNWPVIQAANGRQSLELFQAVVGTLPSKPTAVFSDHPTLTRLAQAAWVGIPGAPRHGFFDTSRGPDPVYRRWFADRSRESLPEFGILKDVQQNVAGASISVLAQLAAEGRGAYLHPSFGFFFERLRAVPNGPGYAIVPQPEGFEEVSIDPARLEALVESWDSMAPALDALVRARELGAKDGKPLSAIWSRNANGVGVVLQRQKRLADAARFFALASRLNPDNRAAKANANVNAALQAGRPIAPEDNKPLADTVRQEVLGTDGPVDEPVFLRNLGLELLSSVDRLPRQVWETFHRLGQLDPGDQNARFGQIEAFLQAEQHQRVRQELDALARSPAAKDPTREFLAGQQRLEIYYALTQGDLKRAESLMTNARTQFANDTSLLDLLTELFIRQGRLDEAIPLLEQWRKLRADDPPATLRLSAIRISRAQWEPALRLLDQLLVLQPDNTAAQLNKAVCLLQLNRLDESKQQYLDIEGKYPELPMLQYGLAEIALRRKSTNAAIEHLERYLKLAPTNTAEYATVAHRLGLIRGGGR